MRLFVWALRVFPSLACVWLFLVSIDNALTIDYQAQQARSCQQQVYVLEAVLESTLKATRKERFLAILADRQIPFFEKNGPHESEIVAGEAVFYFAAGRLVRIDTP